MTTVEAENPFLNNDPSRLPCGVLEHFVFTVDRRALLSASSTQDNEDENKYREDTEAAQLNKSVFVIGDEEHTFYQMLQIQNEIEFHQQHSTDSSSEKINALNKEMTKLIDAEEKKKKDAEKLKRFYATPKRLKTMITRHYIRNFNTANKKEKEWLYKYVEDHYAPNNTHYKPHDPSRTTYASADVVIKKQYASAITEAQINTKIIHQMKEWLDKKTNSYNYSNPNRYFTQRALPWLLQQKLDKKTSTNILSNYNKLMLLDASTVIDMIATDLKDKDSYRQFGGLSIHKQLTLKQLDKVKGSWGVQIGDTLPFLSTYIKKLAPLNIQQYEGKKWDDIPLSVRESYLNTLYEYAIDKVTSNNNGQYTCRAYICWHYMYFMEQMHGIYVIEAIIEYLSIPKYSSYMIPEESGGGLFKAIKNVVTGAARASVGSQFDFLNCFTGIASWNNTQDTKFMKRFFLRLFQYPSMWQTFVALQSNEIRSSKAKSYRKRRVMDVFKEWIDDKWLIKIEAEAMLYSGDASKTKEAIKVLSDARNKTYVDGLKEKVMIEFDKSNVTQCGFKEDLSLTANVKNVSEILVKIFEINTRSYFRDKRTELSTDLNLDGLSASEQWQIDTKALGLNTSFHTKQVKIEWPTSLQKKRGIFFVDLIGSGQHSRAVIKRGNIKYLHRMSAAGHIFQLLDEESHIIEDASIWMEGHSYHSKNNKDFEIFIPFSNAPKNGQKIILQRNDDPEFNVLASFDHKAENYRFQCGLYMDREQLLEKKRAQIMVRSALFLNEHRVSVSLIENCKLSVNIKTSGGVNVDKTFNKFELLDNKESTQVFTVPNECLEIQLSLTGEIKRMTSKNTVNVKQSQSFIINQIDKSRDLSQFHLIPCKHNRYIILLSGKNGEGLSNLDCEIQLYHRWLKTANKIPILQLTTNRRGRIYLPVLDPNIYRIQVRCSSLNNLHNDWLLDSGLTHCDTPNILQMKSGDTIKVPFMDDTHNNGKYMMLYDKYMSRSYEKHFDFKDGYITITKLKTGSYVLKSLDDDTNDIEIQVTDGMLVGNKRYIVNKNTIMELTARESLQIQSIKGDRNEGIVIKIGGISDTTRVHVIATHFIPRFSVSRYLDVLDPTNLKSDFMANTKNEYLDQRTIGEEYRYVLERQTAAKFIGNSLQQPSFLIKPLKHESTETKQQDAKKGENVDKRQMSGTRAQNWMLGRNIARKVKVDAISLRPNEDRANLEFVGETATFLTNLKADKDGMILIDAETINRNRNHNLLRVIATDDDHVAIQSFVLENNAEEDENDIERYIDEKEEKKTSKDDVDYSDITAPVFEYRDTRLFPGLDVNKSFTEQREIALLSNKGDEFKIADYLTSSVEIYETIFDLFNLLQTISSNHELKEKWSFLTEWNKYDDSEKMKQYEDHMCHEFNLFLYFKDNAFFKTVAEPLIASKLFKDVMDLYLLHDVERLQADYTNFNAFNALNVLEQILVASVIPSMKKKTFQYFKDLDETLIVDPQKMDALFQTALASKALQDDGPQDDEKKEVKKEKENEEQPFSRSADKTAEKRQRSAMSKQVLYKQVEKTKEYQETYYHNILYERNTKHILNNENKFWCDFAKYLLSDEEEEKEEKKPFLSNYILFSTHSLNEMLLALAVIDLRFKSKGAQFLYSKQNRNELIISAISPSIVFAKQLAESDPINMSQISIHQHFYDDSDPFTVDENGEKSDKFVDKFVPGKIYGCRAILTNVSSMQQQIEILSQIPTGSIPVDDGFKTRTTFMRLRPYATDQYKFYFYFPQIGTFQQFPVTVSKKGKILGRAKVAQKQLIVSEADIEQAVNVESWKDVSLKGDNEQIIEYLQQHNVYDTDLKRIYWRIKDNESFFEDLCAVLDSQLMYDSNVWGYCTQFKNDSALKQFLLNRSDFMNHILAPHHTSEWLGVYDDVLFGKYSHLEYIPLVNSRAHLLGQKREILNDKFKKQYERFLKRVSYKSKSLHDIMCEDQLAAIYYLLLQDRISEALYIYEQLNKVECSKNYALTYDYLTAYMALYNDSDDEKHIENTINIAREIAIKYGKMELPKSKRKLFEDIELLLSDLGDYKREEEDDEEKKTSDFDLGDRDRVMDKLAQSTPSLEFEIRDRKLVISYQLLEKCTLNFYTMNTEVLFSFSPFLNNANEASNNIFSYIAPNESINLKLAKPQKNEFDSMSIEQNIPESLQNKNLFIQIVSDTITECAPFYDHQLVVHLKENYGHLRVLNKVNPNECIKRGYVKVYAKMRDGSVEFYKDGYTDIRGGFDYAAISTNQLDRATKFSILIATQKYGCLVKEANVPKQ